MTRRILISIDPGLDRSAAAVWDITDWPGRPSDRAGQSTRLMQIEQAVTEPDQLLPRRLAILAAWGAHLATRLPPGASADHCRVVVEWPVFSGNYADRGRQRSRNVLVTGEAMSKLYAATGAIIAGLSRWCYGEDTGVHIELATASKQRRELKQDLARTCIVQAIACGALPKDAANNDDVRSAVSIGLETDWDMPVLSCARHSGNAIFRQPVEANQ